MKDLTSTSIGYVMAFLLPGLVALFGISYWSDTLDHLLKLETLTSTAIGQLFFILLSALTLGLIVSSVRCLVFEKWLFQRCKRFENYRFAKNLFSSLLNEDRLSVFAALVDQHYRYHQFYGGLFVANFIVAFAWWHRLTVKYDSTFWEWIAVYASIQAVMWFSAIDTLKNYHDRANSLAREPGEKTRKEEGKEGKT
jgi:hypothetical protein